MVVRVLPSVNEITTGDWDNLGKPRILFESRDWLSETERSLPGEPLVTVETGAEGLDSLIVWRDLPAEHPSPYFNIGSLLARLTASPRLAPVGWTLNCAGMEMHSQMLAAPGVEFTPARLREHLTSAVASRETQPIMCGVNFLPRDPAPGLPQSMAELGFHEIRGYRHAVLEIPGDSFQDYLAGLTRHRRQNVRRERRLFTRTGQRISIATGPGATGDDLIRLHGINRAKHGGPADEQSLRLFHSAMVRCAGDDILVIRSHLGEACVGFAMFLRDGDALHAMCVGFEDLGDQVGSYFECAYYAAVEWASRNDIREIHYGIGATQAKTERGCQIVDVSTWYLPAEAGVQ